MSDLIETTYKKIVEKLTNNKKIIRLLDYFHIRIKLWLKEETVRKNHKMHMISYVLLILLLVVYLPYIQAEEISINLDLPAGWSMISLPIIPDDASVSLLFPAAEVVYGYEKGSGYVRMRTEDILEVGRGYWILMDQNQNYSLIGQPILLYNKTVFEDGWAMIGGCSYPASVSSENCDIVVTYGYIHGTGYQRVPELENLQPGKGYWVLLKNRADQAQIKVMSLTVGVWLTTGDSSKKLQRQPNVCFIPSTGSNTLQIKVDEKTKYQQMDGFGAAFTDSSAWLIYNKLNASQRNELMTKLFSKTAGIGISYIRIPMGSSDFALTPYTYDDMPLGQTDTNLTNFSIAHDTVYIIPLLQQAKRLNPELKFIGSPWSAPAWMKTSETLNEGSLNSDYSQVYANYFVKFIQAYQAQGIPIHAITIQNEPDFNTPDYPSMYMEAIEQADFVKNYLGQAFQNNNINTKILVWDHNWDKPNYSIDILNDSNARAYVAGSAWHCYCDECTPEAQTQVHEAYPDKDIYFTECTGGGWDINFARVLVWNIQKLFIGSVRNWSKTVLLWNLALDEKDTPHIGGCGNYCRGVVTIYDNEAIGYEVEYYIIGHLSKFVDPGSYRIASNSYEGQIETVAFQNPDGSNVLIALNSSTQSIMFDVLWQAQYFSYNLPPQSVATFKWEANIKANIEEPKRPLVYQDFEGSGELGWSGTAIVRKTVPGEPVHSGDYAFRAESSKLWNYFYVLSKDQSWDVDFIQENNDCLTFWIYALPSGGGEGKDNTVAVKFYDTNTYNENGFEAWTRYTADFDQWTKLTILFSQLPSDFDLRHVNKLEFKNYWPGIYYLDDIQGEKGDFFIREPKTKKELFGK